MELYHVINHGIDKRDIFIDTGDHVRFVHGLYEFNSTSPSNNTTRHLKMNDIGCRSLGSRLVDIHGWCLVKNHYHLLLSGHSEDGVREFVRKLNIGYAKFYNDKYKRRGPLFQGPTKKIPVETLPHFLYILHYVHLNALDLSDSKDWRLRDKLGIRDIKSALAHLKEYRWSSYLDYVGQKNFPSILTTNLFTKTYGPYLQSISKFLQDSEFENSVPSLE